ncbi:hypothetical protein KZ813_06045 [Sphingomonas sp. RHCKR7]|nr:hypothetical protein [Sphingomonas folli]
MLLCAAALLLKLLVPAGYMLASEHGRVAIVICPGMSSAPAAAEMPAMHGGRAGHGDRADHGKAEMPCAFAGLSSLALAAADPIQLAALIAFVVAGGRAADVVTSPLEAHHLRPPLRGPPASF